jgi:uncharacterized delta-60 repeat protein
MRTRLFLALPVLLAAPLTIIRCVSDPMMPMPDAGTKPDSSTSADGGADTMMQMDTGIDSPMGPCIKEAGAAPGALDPSFTNSATNTGMSPTSVAIDVMGNIYVAGLSNQCGFSTTRMAVMKFDPKGVLVSTFGTAGKACVPGGPGNDLIYAIAIDGAGKIVVGGSFRTAANDSTRHAAVVRLTATGAVDTTFGSGTGKVDFTTPFNYVYSLFIDSMGRILVAGSNEHPFTYQTAGYVMRLNPAGTLDMGFNNGTVIADNTVHGFYGITSDTNGVYVTGSSPTSYSVPRAFIVKKYTPAGALDTSFGANGIATANVLLGDAGAEGHDLFVTPSGSLWVLGVGGLSGTTEEGFPLVTAMTPAGAPDMSTFPMGVVPGRVAAGQLVYDTNYFFKAHAMACDGKPIIVGRYDSNNGQDIGITRFLTSGQVDMGFGTAGLGLTKLNGNQIPVGIARDPLTERIVVVGGTQVANQFVLVRFVL